LNANIRLEKPFFDQPDWPSSGNKSLNAIATAIKTYSKTESFQKECQTQTRIFYIESFFKDAYEQNKKHYTYDVAKVDKNPKDWITRLLVRVPFIYVNAGELQDGKYFRRWNDPTLTKATKQYDLISNEERVLSRRKIICTPVQVIAKGGYPHGHDEVKLLSNQKRVIMLSVLGPQLDTQDKFDHSYFISSNKNGVKFLDQPLFFRSAVLDVYLWMHGFNEMVKLQNDGRQGLLKVAKVGAGFFAKVPDLKEHQGDNVTSCLWKAFHFIMTQVKFSHIAVVEFLFFDSIDQGQEQIGKYEVRYNTTDILNISKKDYKEYNIGITNPSDAWSCVGNEMGYDSLEAMLGNNTTLRLNQVYHWNKNLLDQNNYHPVKMPSKIIGDCLFSTNGRYSTGSGSIAKPLANAIKHHFPNSSAFQVQHSEDDNDSESSSSSSSCDNSSSNESE